jgi:molybdopterin-containing oxidoreductase family membrane subunit
MLPGLIGLAVLVIIGIIAWGYQLAQGMSVLGISQAVVWGAYIAAFFTLAGLASGLVIIAALGDLLDIAGIKSHRRAILIGAIATYVASGFMILMDIGRPLRVLNMIFSTNITSPFMWDFTTLVVSVILTAIYLYLGAKNRWLPAVAAFVAALVIVMEGWILSMSAGGMVWRSGIMPAVFLLEGLIAGAAILLIARPEHSATGWLRKALLVLLPIVVVLNVFEVATVLYNGDPEAQAATNLYLKDWLFWGQVVLGIAVPFALLLWAGKQRSSLILAGVLAILGVFAAKYVVLVAGQALPYMQAPVNYAPTLTEVGGVLGIAGLAGLLFWLGVRYIPAKEG